MQRLQEPDAEVVRDDRAGEPPPVPQDGGQQGVVRRRRNTVELGVGVHDGARTAVADRHLERRQDHVGELARADRDGRQVASGAAGRVPGEVLQRGDDARALEATDVGGADGADEVRVLTDRLLGAAPAVVARHVQHGGEPLVHARRTHRRPDPGGHLLDQLRVEARAPGQRDGVGGGAPGGEPGEALLVHEGGDAPPVRGDDLRLRGGQRARSGDGVDRGGAERAGQLPEPVGDDLRTSRGRRRSSPTGAGRPRRPSRRRRPRGRPAARASRRGSSGRPGRRPGPADPEVRALSSDLSTSRLTTS